ncbi:MAG: hypothetical protein QG597_3809 [Actinomycetota bacterium]|nr:hypothetical protein [Actinomycetota bacterium]
MDPASRYVEQVDRVLGALCALLPAPTGDGGVLRAIGDSPAVPEVPGGTAGLAAVAGEAADRYRAAGVRASAMDDSAGSAVRDALAAVEEGARAVEGIRRVAHVRAEALLPAANTPAGLRTLVDTMGAALTSAQNVISGTRAQISGAAEDLRRHRDDWQAVLGPEPTG